MRDARERIVNAVILMATHWGITMDAPRLAIYANLLSDLPPGAVEKGIEHLMKTETFGGVLPVVGKIREAADDYLAEEHYLLEGPGKKMIVITPENAHKYADKGCPVCKGQGFYVGQLPGMKSEVRVRCDCVKEPEQ